MAATVRGVLRAVARNAADLRLLPPRVALFHARAWLTAWRTKDEFSLASRSRPEDVAALLALARGHDHVVELGTGTAWTAIALALDDDRRRVTSYDPVAREERGRYLALVPAAVRARIELRPEPAQDLRPQPASAGLVFIDCAHDRETTTAAFRAWQAAVVPGGSVAFHDYDHPHYPGVREAVDGLGLPGRPVAGMFVWRSG